MSQRREIVFGQRDQFDSVFGRAVTQDHRIRAQRFTHQA